MSKLNLVYAPDPVYKKQSIAIDIIDEEVIQLAEDMVEFTLKNQAYGVSAPMFGISRRIIVVNTQESPIVMINPVIISNSEEKDLRPEQSLSFLGIEVNVERPKSIKLEYTDLSSKKHIVDAEGIFARCIQHEVDYLNGKNLLSINYISKLKSDILIKKMLEYRKSTRIPHIHSSSCNH